jgi:hypothetical protein
MRWIFLRDADRGSNRQYHSSQLVRVHRRSHNAHSGIRAPQSDAHSRRGMKVVIGRTEITALA